MNQAFMVELDTSGIEYGIIGNRIPVGRMVMNRTAYYAVKYQGGGKRFRRECFSWWKCIFIYKYKRFGRFST